MKYYFGVYIDYNKDGDKRIAQLTLVVDDLSCEMLAEPGLITFYRHNKTLAKDQAKQLARRYECKFIEYGWGNYKLIKIK
jgi:hypothetical protein